MWISEDDALRMEFKELHAIAVRLALRRIINDSGVVGREADVKLIKDYFDDRS